MSPSYAEPRNASLPDLDQSGMTRFAGGAFDMGNDNGAPAERPRHRRFVEAFLIDRDLVTNAAFGLFADETDYVTDAEAHGSSWGFDGEKFGEIEGLCWRAFACARRAAHPVVQVSWNDAAAYAAWARKRLPTEAEWEYCAQKLAGGDTFGWLNGPDFFAHCGAGRAWNDGPGTSPVGIHDRAAQVRDLVGNVWQWCADDYRIDAYALASNGETPVGGSDSGLKVRRGGAWNVQQAFRLRCSNRGAFQVGRSAPNVGFRCARNG